MIDSPFRRITAGSLIGFFLVAAVQPAGCQRATVIPLVPAGNWRLASVEKISLDTATAWGVDPAIEREYGAKSGELRRYVLVEGAGSETPSGASQTAEALVESLPDPSSAYGLLTWYRSEEMQPSSALDLTFVGNGAALMVRGPLFIRVSVPERALVSASDLRALLIVIGGTHRTGGSAHALLPSLPTRGMVPGSEKYLLGPVSFQRILPSLEGRLVGFDQGAEVQTARYRLRPGSDASARVFVIHYPTPQIARTHFAALEKALPRVTGAKKSLYAARKGLFVLLVEGALSPTRAAELLNEFVLSQGLSWDQPPPSPKPTTLQLAELVLSNLILVLILIALAIFGGVLLFASKRLLKKWFPESGWTREGEGEFITLKLT